MGCGGSTQAQDPNNNEQAERDAKAQALKQQQLKQQQQREQQQQQNNTQKTDTTRTREPVREQSEKESKLNLPELKQEPETEDVDVAKTEKDYPPARPANNKKDDFFFPHKLRHVDKRARQTPDDKASSYQGLVSHLTTGCSSDLEKLRAIFIWLGSQDIATGDYSDATDSETPRGFMKLIQDQRASYSAFFAVLCRHAGLKCVIISGYAKSAGYEVGDGEEKVKTLVNSWNAVYVTDTWRLVFPLWACQHLEGHSAGTHTKVETKGKPVREREEKSEGVTVTQLNEYYFLTNPEELAMVACPLEPKWQLLTRPMSFQKFVDMPYCTQTYHKEKVNIKSKFNCVLKTKEGMCDIDLDCVDTAGMNMDYELFFNNEESDHEISPNLQLNSYVLLNRSDSKWNFTIRFPEIGVYRLVVTGGRGYETDMCYFKIYCKEVQENCQPFPVNPGCIGYGPNMDTEMAGIKALSHSKAIVPVQANRQIDLTFNLTKSVTITTELINKEMPSDQLENCLKQTQDSRKLHVTVRVPERGEYALQIHAQQKGDNSSKNVCNYLLSTEEGRKKRLRMWENPIEKNVRNNVKNMSKEKGTKNVDELEKQIRRFETLDLDDKGDLATAQEALEFKKVQRELHDAINRRHLDTLEKAIKHGKESRFSGRLQSQIKEAEEVRDHLSHLNLIAHDILEMKQSTIAELRSYKLPPPIIYDIMMATFLMLGEKKDYIVDWEDIEVLLMQTGKHGLLRRVRQFDTVDIQPEAKSHVDRVLSEHNEIDARKASAGAGTFYVWLQDVSGAIKKEDNNENDVVE